MLSIKLIVDDMYEEIPSIFLQKNKILHVCTGFEKCIKK